MVGGGKEGLGDGMRRRGGAGRGCEERGRAGE